MAEYNPGYHRRDKDGNKGGDVLFLPSEFDKKQKYIYNMNIYIKNKIEKIVRSLNINVDQQ